MRWAGKQIGGRARCAVSTTFASKLVYTTLLDVLALHRRLCSLTMFMRGVVERHHRHLMLTPVHLEVILPRFVLFVTVVVGNHFSGCTRYDSARVTQEELIYAVT